MSNAAPLQNSPNRCLSAAGMADERGAEQLLHRVLRRRGIALRCRTAQLAGALRRFRERQAEIDAGHWEATITIPPVAANAWINAAA